ncbi:MAG: hypothetical protein ABI824_11960 [Acidobacteriota bacterium]
MRFLYLLALLTLPVFAQIEPGVRQYMNLGTDEYYQGTVTYELTYEVVLIKDTKFLLFNVKECFYPPIKSKYLKGYIFATGYEPVCNDVDESMLSKFSAVGAVEAAFYSQFPDGSEEYGPFASPGSAQDVVSLPSPRLKTVSPRTPVNDRLIFLDGLGNTLMAMDMSNLQIISNVVVPSTVGPLGIRPSATLPQNEVWVANGGTAVTVSDLGTQQVVTNILTPQLPVGLATAGIVFTKDGKTAFEAVKFFSPDASGNQGALVAFDAVNRKVTSTLLFKFQPVAILAAPDGYSLYLLNADSTITYYDILSGTADLTISTFTPGKSGGFNPAGQVYVHPDGTRLLWSSGGNLEVFDLTTRKVIHQFSFGLPSTIAASAAMTMSQDGNRVYISDSLGDVITMETDAGGILMTSNTGTATSVFGGPPTK